MYFKDVNKINDELSRYNSVTKEDLKGTIQKYFVDAKMVILNYIPKKVNAK
jgi:hypothetical protein